MLPQMLGPTKLPTFTAPSPSLVVQLPEYSNADNQTLARSIAPLHRALDCLYGDCGWPPQFKNVAFKEFKFDLV